MAWTVTSGPGELTTDSQVSILLLLYLPRRGLIEVSVSFVLIILINSSYNYDHHLSDYPLRSGVPTTSPK